MIEDERVEKKNKVLDYLTHLPIYRWAAKSIGKDEDTLIRWRNEDPDFAEKCEIAKSAAIKKLSGRATPDFILKNVAPADFKEKSEVKLNGKPIIQLITYEEVKNK